MFNLYGTVGVDFATVTDGLSNTIMCGETRPDYTVHSTLFYSCDNISTTNTPLNVNVVTFCLGGPPDADLHGERPTEYCDGFKSCIRGSSTS